MITKSTLLFAAFFILAARIVTAQPVRLWSYAKYHVNSSTGTRVVDTGRFAYSEGRGVAIDSTTESLYFFHLLTRTQYDDYPQLNPWFKHKYQALPPRMVPQFDSFRSWVYQVSSPTPLRPYITHKKRHTADKLDTLQVAYTTGTPQAFEYLYDTSGKITACRIYQQFSAGGPWTRIQVYIPTRDSDGRMTRLELQHGNGSNMVWGIKTYHYNPQGLLDTVRVVDSIGGNVSPVSVENLAYDTLGRLHTVRQQHFLDWTQNYRDSFCYDGISNRYTDIYRLGDDSSPLFHYTYTYDANGWLIGFSESGNGATRTFHRNDSGLITQIDEVRPGVIGTFKTYYYYDSLDATSLKELATPAQIEIHPNPATDKIFVQSAKKLSAYRLCSITGQMLRSGSLSDAQQPISVEGLPPGAYVLYAEDKNGNRQAAQVMKR